jgi:rRNA maturation endonuclease Nob1
MPTDPEVIKANFEADDGWREVCRECGKTPQDIGFCDKCGYNRPYERVRSSRLQ